MSKNKIYKGIIVLESLEDPIILKSAQMINTEKTTLGTVHTVLISKNQIDALPEYIKEGPWYAHFWHGGEILVVFKNETFILHPHKPKEREAAIKHGLKIGIEEESLNFPID
jgi:hypothetical protein